MQLRRGSRVAAVVFATLAATALTAGRATAASDQGTTFVPASRANYSSAHRPTSAIRLIVVHVTDGSYAGTIRWFRNPRAHASANYVVSREGAITQMVPNTNVAWHAGNPWVNEHSIGVEHEGYTGLRAVFTDAEYRASARLVGGLLRHYVLPIDRHHVIGHDEVRDPLRPWLVGGYAHHTDPGHYWDWRRYMSYVRSYARGFNPPRATFDVTIPAFRLNQRLGGVVAWPAVVSGQAATHVNFLVDGQLRDSETEPPYALNGAWKWDTRLESNGQHTLSVRAVSPSGRTAEASVLVTVKNAPPPPPQIRSIGFVEGEVVSGEVRWEVTTGGPVRRVEFYVDGVLRGTERRPPYVFGGDAAVWDTTSEVTGPHTLKVRVIGARTARSASVDVFVEGPATGGEG